MRRLFLVPLAVLLASCGTVPPATSPTASVTASPTASATSPTAAPSSPSVTASATTDVGADLILRADGLASFDFGAAQAGVAELLSDQLGAPDETTQGIVCELDDSSPWGETVSYGGLWVQYQADDRKKSSQRHLAAWGFTLSEELISPLRIEDDLPLTLSYAELKSAYPKGKLEDLGFGDGQKMFTLPNKLRFVGGTKKPETLQAGSFAICE